MKNTLKTSYYFIFLLPLLFLGACAKDVTGVGESTGGGDSGGDFIPDDPFADMGDNPPSSSLTGTWNMTATVTESDCSDYTMGSEHDFTLTIDSDGNCTNSLSSSADCQASDSEVISDRLEIDWLSTYYPKGDGVYGFCDQTIEQLDSATLNSSVNLSGETKIEVTFPHESCGTSCQVTAILVGVLDEGTGSGDTGGSGTSGGDTTTGDTTSGDTSGGSGSTGTDGGSGSGSDTGTEASTITVTSSQIVKDTLNATVEITNNTSVSSLIVKVLLQKSISGGLSSGAFETRNAVLGPKTLIIESGTTETKTLSFKIPENLSGTYSAKLVLQYVDEEGITQTLDTDLIRNLEIE